MKIRQSVQAGVASCLAVASAGALAQTGTVQIYGNLDVGMTYVSNTGGKSNVSIDSGVSKPSRLGFRGTEDLGGGTKVSFILESGLNVDTGAQADATTIFSREASLGIQTATLGTIKLGRMTDFFLGDLDIIDSTPLVQGGLTSGIIGYSRPFGTPGAAPAVSLHYPGAKYNNSMKWMREFGPFRAGVMYGFGAENGNDKMHSVMLRYTNGNFRIGGAYTKDNFTAALFARETFGLKAQYKDGDVLYFANYGVGKDPRTQAKTRPLEIGLQYAATPQWRIGGGLGHAWATNDIGRKARITQPFAGVKYLLSKRTELYVTGAINRSSDKTVIGATVGVPGGATAVSTGSSMNVVRVGMLHNF